MSLAALIEYKNISKKTLQESIESEMSGNLEDLLVAVGERSAPSWRPDMHVEWGAREINLNNLFSPPLVKCVKSVPAYMAERLFKSMRVSPGVNTRSDFCTGYSLGVTLAILSSLNSHRSILKKTNRSLFFLVGRKIAGPIRILCQERGGSWDQFDQKCSNISSLTEGQTTALEAFLYSIVAHHGAATLTKRLLSHK